jgi:hypothetical protein
MGILGGYRNRCYLFRNSCGGHRSWSYFDMWRPTKHYPNIVSLDKNKIKVNIDQRKVATQKFRAYGYLNDRTTIYKDIVVSVKLMCDPKKDTITKTTMPTSVTLQVGQPYTYQFGVFAVKAQPNCGWKQPYSVAVTSGDKTRITYPRKGVSISTCKSFKDCREISVDTSRRTSVGFRITGVLIAGSSSYGDVKINIVCGPKSTKISPVNVAVPGSLLTMDRTRPNFLIQSILQDSKSPIKRMPISRVVIFKSSHSDCRLEKWEIVNPSKGVSQKGSELFFSAADKTPQTFQVRVTASGGASYLTPKITINKTCASISKSYTHSLTYHAKKGSVAVQLPFLNLGDKHGCGIQKIDHVPSNKEVIVQKGNGCPGALCNSIAIDTGRPGTYSYYARATLNDKSTITTTKYSIRVICDKNVNRLSRGSMSSATVFIGSKYSYEFGAF